MGHIPQLSEWRLHLITTSGEVASFSNGEGGFRNKSPMPVIALFVVIWLPVTVAAYKWLADA